MRTYIQVENISKSYGDITLFSGLTFNINEGQKIALIARNGTGKSSLLNIIAGNNMPDSGDITILKDIVSGYLPQDPSFNEERTVFEEIYASSGGIMEIVRNYELALEDPEKKGLEQAMLLMEQNNAWDYETRIKQILTSLKITDFNQVISQLSGGQKKRLALAVTLILEPDLLILDEPTNHLDLDMIEWLEDYLERNRCTLFIVTHDRYFLDRVCNEILELDEGVLYRYNGNYSQFLENREERITRTEAEIDKARNLLRTETEWMRRMPQARATKAKARIDAFYDLKEQASRRIQDKNVELNVKIARLGSKILECKNLSKRYGDKILIEDFSYSFARFEKVGIIGENGSGKTTLLNILTEQISPDNGTIDTGETVVYGYYRQEGLSFKPGQRVIDVVKDIAEVVTLGDGKTMPVSQYLNFFLFPPEMQYTYIEKLSGGEKRRLYLMTVLMKNPNFLILDEPTNDLDIATLDILEQYLQTFNGCLIMVSHDRYFMDNIVDHLFVFKGNGIIKDFTGNYTEYRQASANEKPIDKPAGKPIEKSSKKSSIQKSDNKEITNKNTDTGNNQIKRKRTWKENREFEEIEKKIEDLEIEKNNLENEISSGSLQGAELIEAAKKLGDIVKQLDENTDRWLELSEI